jgi:hypothetical protein
MPWVDPNGPTSPPTPNRSARSEDSCTPHTHLGGVSRDILELDARNRQPLRAETQRHSPNDVGIAPPNSTRTPSSERSRTAHTLSGDVSGVVHEPVARVVKPPCARDTTGQPERPRDRLRPRTEHPARSVYGWRTRSRGTSTGSHISRMLDSWTLSALGTRCNNPIGVGARLRPEIGRHSRSTHGRCPRTSGVISGSFTSQTHDSPTFSALGMQHDDRIDAEFASEPEPDVPLAALTCSVRGRRGRLLALQRAGRMTAGPSPSRGYSGTT